MILENESGFSAENMQEAVRTGHPIGSLASKMSVKDNRLKKLQIHTLMSQ